MQVCYLSLLKCWKLTLYFDLWSFCRCHIRAGFKRYNREFFELRKTCYRDGISCLISDEKEAISEGGIQIHSSSSYELFQLLSLFTVSHSFSEFHSPELLSYRLRKMYWKLVSTFFNFFLFLLSYRLDVRVQRFAKDRNFKLSR